MPFATDPTKREFTDFLDIFFIFFIFPFLQISVLIKGAQYIKTADLFFKRFFAMCLPRSGMFLYCATVVYVLAEKVSICNRQSLQRLKFTRTGAVSTGAISTGAISTGAITQIRFPCFFF